MGTGFRRSNSWGFRPCPLLLCALNCKRDHDDLYCHGSWIDIPSDLKEDEDDIIVALVEGTASCWKKENNALTFSSLTSDTICSIDGTFSRRIIIDIGDDDQFELELNGLTLYSDTNNPITVLSGDNVTLTAKKRKQQLHL